MPALALEADPDPLPPQRTRDLVPRLVHPRTGLVKALGEVASEPGEAPLPLYSAVVSRRLPSRLGLAGAPADLLGTGVARERVVAQVRAVGEAVERYALATTAGAGLVRATSRELGSRALRPEDLVLLTDEERARHPRAARLEPDVAISWREGARLRTGETVLVPASLVHNGLAWSPAERFTTSFPSGSACATSLTEAVARALGEAMERDALAIAWRRRAPLARIRVERVRDGDFLALLEATTRAGREVALFETTNDVGYPAFTALLVDRSGRGPALAQGTGAGFDPEAAALRALEEAVHMRARYRLLKREARDAGNAAFRWWPVESLRDLAFLLDVPEDRDLPRGRAPARPRERLDASLALLARAGLDPLAVDATPADVRGLGLHVAAVIVPGLAPKASSGLLHAGTPRLSRGRPLAELWDAPFAFP